MTRAVCLVCGDPMEALRSTRRYCSTRCRVKAAREALSVTAPEAPAATPGTDPQRAATADLAASPAVLTRPRLPRDIEVRHIPGGRLSNGSPSGVGGRTTYIVDGREYATPREAHDAATA
jgi:hypothetical protein